MATKQSLKKLNNLSTMPKNLGLLGTYRWQMEAFVNFLEQIAVPNIKIVDGLDAKVKTDIEGLNTEFAKNYKKIKKDAAACSPVVDGMIDAITKARAFARHAKSRIKVIYDEAVKYKTNPAGYDTTNAKDALNSMIKQIDHFMQVITDKKGLGKAQHDTLNADVELLNTDMDNMQKAIPLKASQKINLSKLTEKDAMDKLTGQVDDLNDKIDTLQTEIFWETVGEAVIGVVGAVVFITNFWNPIGWVVGAAAIGGDIALAADKAGKAAQLTMDQEQETLTEEEEKLIKPFYAIKNHTKMLKNLVAELDGINGALQVMKSDYQVAEGDVKGFLDDLSAKDFDDLKFDYNDVIGDFDQVYKDGNTLLGQPTTKVITPAELAAKFKNAKKPATA